MDSPATSVHNKRNYSLLFFIFLIAVCYADITTNILTTDLKLIASPTSVNAGLTKCLTVNCSFAPVNGSDVTELVSLILSKSNYNSPDYNEVASINFHSHDHVLVTNTSLGAKVTGHLSPINGNAAFLALEWNHPGEEATGQYQCQAFGIKNNGHPTVSTVSTEIIGAELSAPMCMSVLRNLTLAHDSLLTELKIKTDELSNLTKENNHLSTTLKNQTEEIVNLTKENEDLLRKNEFLLDTKLASGSYNGHTYILTKPVDRNITKSDLLCQMVGGYLVEINNKAEYNFVYDFVFTKNNIDKVVIGVTDENHEGTWTFVHSGNPALVVNKHDVSEGRNANCLEIWRLYAGMVDEPCYRDRHHGNNNVVCEVPHWN